MFPHLPARATFVVDTNFVSGPDIFVSILCPQQMFPSLRSMETQHSFCVPSVCAPKNIMSNNVFSFARALFNLIFASRLGTEKNRYR